MLVIFVFNIDIYYDIDSLFIFNIDRVWKLLIFWEIFVRRFEVRISLVSFVCFFYFLFVLFRLIFRVFFGISRFSFYIVFGIGK